MSNVGGAASMAVVSPTVSRSSTFLSESDRGMSHNTGSKWHARERNWGPLPDDMDNHPNRTLVLCFDGTGDQFDDDNSNVVQLVSMLKKDDPRYQMVYYQTGIGTYTSPSIPSIGMRSVMKVLDQMLAWNLESHVLQGYEFLMQNYMEGDKICIFGFSRGAYTARALAGMLQKVGLLPPCNHQQLPFAYAMYSRDDEDTMKLAREFKQSFCIDVVIEFLGVWDTVASVGIVPKYLPFVGNNSAIRYFRHALALDERRSKFHPLFHAQSLDQNDEDKDDSDDDADPDSLFARLRKAAGSGEDPEAGKDAAAAQYEKEINAENGMKTDVQEVWFAGAHTDVGGGSVQNHTRHSLARIPLRWMIRECYRCETGLVFDLDLLQNEIGMDVDFKHRRVLEAPKRLGPTAQDVVPHLTPGEVMEHIAKAVTKKVVTYGSYPIKLAWWLMGSPFRNAIIRTKNKAKPKHKPVPPPPAFQGEAQEELRDALSPMYDQLQLSRPWWILEYLPLKRKKQKAIYDLSEKASDYVWVINNGRGRKIFKHIVRRGIKIHRSVLTRLEAQDHDGKESYEPQILPNITIKREDGKEIKFCRRMSNDEWRKGIINGLDLGTSWFKWV